MGTRPEIGILESHMLTKPLEKVQLFAVCACRWLSGIMLASENLVCGLNENTDTKLIYVFLVEYCFCV